MILDGIIPKFVWDYKPQERRDGLIKWMEQEQA